MAGDADPGTRSGGFRHWALLHGDREAVAAVTLLAVAAFVVALGRAGVFDVNDPAAVRTLGGALIPGLFTFLSIVIAINQLVLSQEFGSAAEIRDRVRSVRSFRRDVEVHAGEEPSPVTPTAFVATVLRAVVTAAADLDAAVADASAPADRELSAFARDVERAAGAAAERLERTERGRIHAVLAVLEYPHERQVATVRDLAASHEESLSREVERAVADLVEVLELLSVARSHFRSMYAQRVLARLSRRLLYLGVPAILAAVGLVLLSWSPAVAAIARFRLAIVAVLLAVALSPLALLFAYVLRIATVSERTVGVGPFVARPAVAAEADDAATGRDGDDRERDAP